jgi:hypothetical protein
MSARTDRPRPEGEVYFTKYITLRNGKRLYASAYGLNAFCIRRKKKVE